MRILRPLVFLSAVAALAAACAPKTITQEGPAPGVQVSDPAAPYAGLRMNTVAILDRSLQAAPIVEDGKTTYGPGKLAVESSGAERTATGTLQAFAVLRNRTDFNLRVECRTQFFDKNEVPVEKPTAWQHVFLPPNSIGTYRESSTGVQDVAYYYIEIREAR